MLNKDDIVDISCIYREDGAFLGTLYVTLVEDSACSVPVDVANYDFAVIYAWLVEHNLLETTLAGLDIDVSALSGQLP